MTDSILSSLNAPSLFLIAGGVIVFILLLCLVFLLKSYRAGLAMGMDKASLKRAITGSATFTILPSVSILLGVIALSGSLGVPLPWIRLSVVGALHYEATVADVAARNVGMTGGLGSAPMDPSTFVTIALLMTVGIIWSAVLCIFLCKWYSNKLNGKGKKNKAILAETQAAALPDEEPSTQTETEVPTPTKPKKATFGNVMFVAMFIGLVSTYIGSYLGIFATTGDYMPIAVAIVSGLVMALCEYIVKKTNWVWLESFSMALSMLVGMSAAILFGVLA